MNFSERPLLVLALGGNALSPPREASASYQVEREIIARTGRRIAVIAQRGYRLLIVHGNGPQVGRLLRQDPGHSDLDIHIAQTQGELGYLLKAATALPVTALLTTVIVGETPGGPVKPIGPVLERRPPARTPAVEVEGGWRMTVPSPKPVRVIETDAVRTMLSSQHVIAGGGGGVPLNSAGEPVAGVVDKDWVASLLAVALGADRLLFATDVDHVFSGYGRADAMAIDRLSAADALALARSDDGSAGSMAPKLQAAADYAAAMGTDALICHLEQIDEALAGRTGTRVSPG